MARLRTALACLCLALLAAILLPFAIAVWQKRADIGGAITGFRLIADRGAALIGETEPDDTGEPFTVARLVATGNGTLAKTTSTVEAVRVEIPRTAQAVRGTLNETTETVKAVRPVLDAATSAMKKGEAAIVRMDGRVDALLESAGSVTNQVRDALPDFLDCNGNRNCLFNRWAGLSWEAERTMRAIAASANRVEGAVPNFLATWDRVGRNSDRTTAATAEVMTNFAAATKPLPKWMRLGIAVAPPVVQVGASVVTSIAITGRHK